MKRLLTILLLAGAAGLSAQNEVKTDSIRQPQPNYNFKQFGDFVLDMSILSPPKLPSFSANLLGPDMTKDYNVLFQLPSQLTLIGNYMPTSYHSYGYGYGYGFFSTPQNLQGASFRINDNIRLNTYGQYRLDGRRVPNPGALPWEKNNFVGGMELKFNKNFGIRIEVRQGRNPAYPY